jgi:hypothetical protein
LALFGVSRFAFSNVLGHHFRFNKQKLDEFMPLDTK